MPHPGIYHPRVIHELAINQKSTGPSLAMCKRVCALQTLAYNQGVVGEKTLGVDSLLKLQSVIVQSHQVRLERMLIKAGIDPRFTERPESSSKIDVRKGWVSSAASGRRKCAGCGCRTSELKLCLACQHPKSSYWGWKK